MIAPSHSQIGGLVGKAFCEAGYTRFVEIIGPQIESTLIHKHEAFARVLHQHGISCQIRTFCMQIYNLKQATQQVLEHIELFQPGTACFKIQITGTVDVYTPGTYELTYYVVDSNEMHPMGQCLQL